MSIDSIKPSKKTTLLEEWEDYLDLSVSEFAPEAYRLNVEDAFYAGALACFALLLKSKAGDEPTDSDIEAATTLHNEILLWINQKYGSLP